MHNKVDVLPWVLADTQVQPQLVNVIAGEAGGPAWHKAGIESLILRYFLAF